MKISRNNRIKIIVCLLVILFSLFINMYCSNLREINANPVLIDGSLLCVVGAVMVIAGYVFATDEDVQKAATDFYNNAPEATRQKMYDVATSPAFVAGVSLIAIDMDMIEDVKDYYVANYQAVQTQVSAFSRWWNANFSRSELALVSGTEGTIYFPQGVTAVRPYKTASSVSDGYGHTVDKWGITQEQRNTFLAQSVPSGYSLNWSLSYINISVKVGTVPTFDVAIVEDVQHYIYNEMHYVQWNDDPASAACGSMFYPTNVYYQTTDLSFGLYENVNYSVDTTYGREGVLKSPQQEDRLGTATYPYSEVQVNSPSGVHDLTNTRVVDVPYTETGSVSIPWGSTVSGIPISDIYDGELVITEPVAQTVELENNSINFDSYRNNWELFLDKFPFCIPFDLANAVGALYAEEKIPIIEVDLSDSVFVGGTKFDIDFTIFDGIAKVIKWGVLIIFNVSLIILTRKLIRG